MEEGKGLSAGYIALIIFGVFIIIGAIVGLWYMDKRAAPEREAYTSLASCLSSRDVTFYSAFWCPNCAAQKALFKGSWKRLPHRECSLPDRTQNEFCEEAGITNYPTWEFDGSLRCIGVVDPVVLAHLAGCPLPTYGDVSYTAQGLYGQLVVEATEDRLKMRGISGEQIDEVLEELRTEIDGYLIERYQTSVDEVTDREQMLDAIAEVVYSCEPYEREEEEVDGALDSESAAGIEIDAVEEEGAVVESAPDESVEGDS